MTESAVTDFPEPDSPTSASVSPLRMSKETRSTASASRSPWPKATERSRTERRGDVTMLASEYVVESERVDRQHAYAIRHREPAIIADEEAARQGLRRCDVHRVRKPDRSAPRAKRGCL